MTSSKLTPILTAALVAAAALACRKPAPAPKPEPPKAAAPAQAQATVDTSAQKAADEAKRRAEEAAEAARKAAAEAQSQSQAAYKKAAEAALRDVHFDYDKASFRDEDKAVLAGIAGFMKQYPQANLFIDGNCDDRGTVEYNLALGDRRAVTVRDYLVGLGVPAARLSTTSYGKEKPVCQEAVESCWFRNRRAHFSLK